MQSAVRLSRIVAAMVVYGSRNRSMALSVIVGAIALLAIETTPSSAPEEERREAASRYLEAVGRQIIEQARQQLTSDRAVA